MNNSRQQFEGMVYYRYEPGQPNSTQSLLLMIHGHGGDHRGLEELAASLNMGVVIPDLPGFGESSELSEKHTIENYVRFLKKFMSAIGAERYMLLGHSLGSAIALALTAEDQRVSHLVLLNPVPDFTKRIKFLIRSVNGLGHKMPEKMADAFVKAKLYNLATFLIHSRRRNDREYATKYLKTQNTARYSFKTWSESGESIFFFDQVALAKQITSPALILHGERDSLTTGEAIQHFSEALNAQLIEIPGTGHFLPLEHTAEAAEPIKAFLGASHE